MKPLTRDDVRVEIDALPEDLPFEGNCSAIGDVEDQANEQWIRDQLASGNDLAWCCARVTVTPRDARLDRFASVQYLDGVSCADQADFDALVADHGMVEEALDELNTEIRQVHAALCGGES